MLNATPVKIDQAFANPNQVRAMVLRHAPYWPVMRYFANATEEAAQNGAKKVDSDKPRRPMVVMPVFRGDWAYDEPKVDGAQELLYDEQLIAAAKQVFNAEVVVPHIVFVNLTTPMPSQGVGHVDIPAFRGIDRTQYPTWLLQMMGQSGLFEDVRVRIATSVAWLYHGENGGFSWWPDGPDGPRSVHDQNIDNTAIVGDNDFMFHRVEQVGTDGEPTARNLTLDSLLHPADESAPDGDWAITDEGKELYRVPFEKVRVSISWKARVFSNSEEQRITEEHLDDIALDEVVDRFLEDLTNRGIACDRPPDPITDTDFITTVASTYRLTPSTE